MRECDNVCVCVIYGENLICTANEVAGKSCTDLSTVLRSSTGLYTKTLCSEWANTRELTNEAVFTPVAGFFYRDIEQPDVGSPKNISCSLVFVIENVTVFNYND